MKKKISRKKLYTIGALSVVATAAAMLPNPIVEDSKVEAAMTKLGDQPVGTSIFIKSHDKTSLIEYVVLKHVNGASLIAKKIVGGSFTINGANEVNNISNFFDRDRFLVEGAYRAVGIDRSFLNNVVIEQDWVLSSYPNTDTNYGPSSYHSTVRSKIGFLSISEHEQFKDYLIYDNTLREASRDFTFGYNGSLHNLTVIPNSNNGALRLSVDNASVNTLYRDAYYIPSNYIINPDGSYLLDITAPSISATEQTTYGNSSQVSVNATDSETGVPVIKYAQGSYNTSNFPSNGTNITASKSFTVPSNGTYTIYAEDGVGNKSVQIIDVTKVDAVAPTLTLTPSTTAATNQNVTVQVTGADTHSGVAQVKWAAGNQNAAYFASAGTVISNNTSFTVTANGTYTAYVKDNAGNTAVKTITINNIDKTPPTNPTFTKSTAAPTNQAVNVTIAYSNDSTVKQYKVGSAGAWTNYTGPITVEENDTVYAKAADAVGNYTTEVSVAVDNIDKVAPVISIASNYDGKRKKQFTATVGATDNVALATIRYAWVLEPNIFNVLTWENTTNGAQLLSPTTADGDYFLHVKATDTAGNETAQTFEHAFTVDNTPPVQPVLTADETAPTKQDVTVTPTFSEDSVLQEVRVNDGAWEVYGTPIVLTENGTIQSRGTDEAGNVSSVTEYSVVNIDKTAPVAPTLSVDQSDWTNQNITVTAIFAADTALGEYSMDEGQTWTEYAAPVVVEQNQNVLFRATDAVGNTNVATAMTVANIDKDAPNVPTADYAINGNKLVYVPGMDNVEGKAVTVEYRLNDGEWATFENELTLPDGNYTIEMRSIDHVGNTSPSVTFEWRVYYEALQEATVATEQAEAAVTQMSIDEAKVKVEAMGEVQEKATLLSRINDVQLIVNDINLANEIQATLNQMEPATVTSADVSTVQVKIDQLMETSRKTTVQAHLDKIQQILHARTAVEHAEVTAQQADKDIAQGLVDALEQAEPFTVALQERLVTLQQIIDYRTQFMTIDGLIETAEQASEVGNSSDAQLTQMRADLVTAQSAFETAITENAPLKLTTDDEAAFKVRLDAVAKNIEENQLINTVEATFVAVGTDEYAFEQADLDSIKVEMDKLTGLSAGTIQDGFTQRLDALQTAYDYRLYKANTEDKVQVAEGTLNQADHDTAFALLAGLHEADRLHYAERLATVQALINDNLLAIDIQQAFDEFAFDTMTQADLTAIGAMVDQALTSARKDGFITKLAEQQMLLNARLAVELAEEKELQVDKDNATVLVEALPTSPIRTNLESRLDTVQKNIDYREFVKELERLTLLAEGSSELGQADLTQMQADYDLAKAQYDTGTLENAVIALNASDKSLYEERLQAIEALIQENTQIVAIETMFTVVGTDVTTMDQAQLDNLASEIQKLTALSDGPIQDGFDQRLNSLQVAYDYHLYLAKMEDATVLAEGSLTQPDHDTAKALLVGLNEADKTGYANRLQAVQEQISDNELEVVLNQFFNQVDWETVELTELTTIQGLINTFYDATRKPAFEEKLNALQPIVTAREAVVQAETGLIQADKDAATVLVEALVEPTAKQALTDRLIVVQEKIDYQIHFNDMLSVVTAMEGLAGMLGKTTPDTIDIQGIMTTIDSAFVQIEKDTVFNQLNNSPLNQADTDLFTERLNVVQTQINDGLALEKIYVLLAQLPNPYEQSHLDELFAELQKIELSPYKPVVAEQLAHLQAELDYDLYLDAVEQAIDHANTTLEMVDYDTAISLLVGLKDADKPPYEDQLKDTLALIQYKQAEKALEKTGQTLSGSDLENAVLLVNTVPERDDLYDKAPLYEVLHTLELLIHAIEGVEQAEQEKTQDAIDTALDAIGKLADSPKKDELLERIDTVQTLVTNRNDYEKALSAAVVAVEKAERTLMQVHKDSAQILVTALQDGADKTALQVRLDALQKQIDEKQTDLLDKIIGDLSSVTAQELADYTGVYVYEELIADYLDVIGKIGDEVTKAQVIEATRLITYLEEAKRSMKQADITKYAESFTNSTVSDLVRAHYPVPTALSSISSYLEDDSALDEAIQEMARTMNKSVEEVQAEVQAILKGEKLATTANMRVASSNSAYLVAVNTVNEAHKQYIYKAFTALAKVKGYVAAPNDAKMDETKAYILRELYNGQFKVDLLAYLGVKQNEYMPYQANELTKVNPKGSDTGANTGSTGGGGSYIPSTPTPAPEVEKPTDKTDNPYGIELVESDSGELKLQIVSELPTVFDKPVQLVLEEEKITLIIDGESYETDLQLPLTDLDDKRVLRGDEELTVPQYEDGKNRLIITTNNLNELVLSATPALTFTDIANVYSKAEIEQLKTLNITNGTTATTYAPNTAITRAQFAAMLTRALELKPKATTHAFSDLKGKWYAGDVQALHEAGIITGFEDGTFKGGNSLTRQQAVAMIGRMLHHLGSDISLSNNYNVTFTDKERIAEYALDAVLYLAEHDVIQQGSSIQFNPQAQLTRAQMAKILMRALELSDWY